MNRSLHPWVLPAAVTALWAGVIAAALCVRSHTARNDAELLARLPADNAVTAFVDFQALRQTGVLQLLAGAAVVEEPEYRNFVRQSGFDYREHLDTALVSFHPHGTFLLLRGRFDWHRLERYAAGQGGSCYNGFCRMTGSTAERRISFFPLQPDAMAMAVSKDASAAALLQSAQPAAGRTDLPRHPLWVRIPGSRLQNAPDLIAGTRLFARALAATDRIVLSAGVEDGRMALFLDATCRSAEDAAALLRTLRGITSVLREMIEREKKTPNPRDLSGVLVGGVFNQVDRRVLGRWPLDRALLENLGSAL